MCTWGWVGEDPGLKAAKCVCDGGGTEERQQSDLRDGTEEAVSVIWWFI